VFREVTAGATSTESYKEQATEFLEETNALDTDFAIYTLKK
jgi:hypothetical protein